MNVIYLALAIGFGYWIGNTKSPQIVYDQSKCAVVEKVEAQPTPGIMILKPVTVEKILQSSPTPTTSPTPDSKQTDDSKPVDPDADKAAWIKDHMDDVATNLVRYGEYGNGTTKLFLKKEQFGYLQDLKLEIEKQNFHITNEGEVNQGGYVYVIEVSK